MAWQDYNAFKSKNTEVEQYFLTTCNHFNKIENDNLPVNMQSIPRSLYVSSKLGTLSIEAMRDRMLNNELFMDEYDTFIGSIEGQKYYAGILSKNEENLMVKRGKSIFEKGKAFLKSSMNTVNETKTSEYDSF